MKTILTTMKKAGQRYRGFLLFYTLACAILSVGLVLTNRLQGEMGEAALGHDVDTLIWLLVLVSGITIIRAICSALSTLWLARFSANAGFNLRLYFIRHFLGAPFAKVEEAGSGESLSIYSNDIPEAANLISDGIMNVISGFISFAVSLVFLLMISPLYTGALVVAFIVMFALVIILSMPMRKHAEEQSKETANFNAVVNDSLQNVSVVVSYDLAAVMEERYMTVYNRYMAATKRVAKASILLVSTAFFALFGPIAVINVVLALGVINSNLTIAEFIAYLATIMMVIGGISEVANGIGNLAPSVARAKRVNENTDHPPEERAASESLDPANPAIVFKNVSFAYGADLPLALNAAQFSIAPGSRVAFVGESGSGKSTILKLLMGLYDPTDGQITISGTDITQASRADLRNMIAYIPQDSFLLPGTIGENITMESTITDPARLQKACAEAGILDFIQSLPNQWDSVLAESSENISGGQRQRIAMARAFYKDAPIILFDEATSSLDPTTEAAIFRSLNDAAKDKTVIMVAHRDSAVAFCDTVIHMEGGKTLV
ncbi:MAG: ABC transporter ATP-binding protein/permease [Defluviitaleaceae bacterium]|nr:ABC transporter ATP-binding protein/permease [Defluviitaleaceae bacterium]